MSDSDADESRTLAISAKRSLVLSDNISSGYSTPNKRTKKHRSTDSQNNNDSILKGTNATMSVDKMSSRNENSGHPPSMSANGSWNQGSQVTIRTSLRSGHHEKELGHNRLVTGFPRPQARLDARPSLAPTQSLAQSSSGESPNDAIEISDESDVDTGSEGGMMINVSEQEKLPESRTQPISDDEMEDGEMLSSGMHSASISSPTSSLNFGSAHQQLQGERKRSSGPHVNPVPNSTAAASRRKLADLNPDELEHQLKYALYYLTRDQIDLSRLVVCTECLQEGHMDSECLEKNCSHCGDTGEHPTRMCPLVRRCLRCRERGHDVSVCKAKLKDTSVPCDYCRSTRHMEDACPMRFFPAVPSAANTQFKLWVSCCNCSSNTHLVGDCPAIDPEQASRWTLKSLNPHQITNMSLESGARKQAKDAMNRGMRPEGIRIRGRAEFHQIGGPQDSEMTQVDDEPFLRPAVGSTRPPPPPLGSAQIQPGRESDSRRRIHIEPVRRHDEWREEPRSNRTGSSWYATDSFGQSRRSRSPDQDRSRNSYESSFRPRSPNFPSNTSNGDRWVPTERDRFRGPRGREDPNNYRPDPRRPRRPLSPPPLPREPLPNRPPSPYSNQRVQLPTRQGTNSWVNHQKNQAPVAAEDFQPKPRQGLQHHQQQQQRQNGMAGRGLDQNKKQSKGNSFGTKNNQGTAKKNKKKKKN